MEEISRMVTQSHYKPRVRKKLFNKILNDHIFIWGNVKEDDTAVFDIDSLIYNDKQYIPIFLDEQTAIANTYDEVGILQVQGKAFLENFSELEVIIHPEHDKFLIVKVSEILESL